MVYFNYFIKCVIRKFVNLLFKPKILLFFILIFCILFVFQLSARAEWTSQDIADLQNTLSRLRTVLIEQLNELEQVKNNTQDIEDQIALVNEKFLLVNGYLNNIQNNTDNLETQLSDILSQLTTINSDILNIYNKLDENQQQLLAELKVENQSVLNELNMIRDSINGSEEEISTYTDLGIINSDDKYFKFRTIAINYEPKYTYSLKIYFHNPTDVTFTFKAYSSDNLLPNDFVLSDYVDNILVIDKIPPHTEDFVINYEVPSSNPTYIYLGGYSVYDYIDRIEVYRSIKGIVESLNDSNSLQQQQNQLQQQQNQLQQEQNDFLKDNNVTNDFSNLPSDTTQDITEGGFNNIFNTLYNTFTNGSAQDLVINVPFTNKSFVINAKNVYGDVNLGLVKTLIQTFWYFVISYFIVKDIGKKINKIKSGNIEDVQEDNIKEDML